MIQVRYQAQQKPYPSVYHRVQNGNLHRRYSFLLPTVYTAPCFQILLSPEVNVEESWVLMAPEPQLFGKDSGKLCMKSHERTCIQLHTDNLPSGSPGRNVFPLDFCSCTSAKTDFEDGRTDILHGDRMEIALVFSSYRPGFDFYVDILFPPASG